MKNSTRFIKCEGVQVAAYMETYEVVRHAVYVPSNVLFYTKQGSLTVEVNQKTYTIGKGSFALIRKYSNGVYSKSWTTEEKGAITYAFILFDEFIQSAIKEFPVFPPPQPIQDSVLLLEYNNILLGLFESIAAYIEENEEIDKRYLELKTREALLGILKYHPSYAWIFSQFITPERADLELFMLHNFTLNVSLNQLAQMSGRSLSTFNREFRRIFKETPHRWIMNKRLLRAKDLLQNTNKRPSEIYIELGFEDLAHFSRAFKKSFGVPPTLIKEQ